MKRLKQDTSEPEITFYDSLNRATFNYEEFKENAHLRLKVLRRLENNIRDNISVKTAEEDLNSHFCLRLVCAQSKWSSNWFVVQETQLFKHKLLLNPSESRRFFLEKVWPHLNVTKYIEHSTVYDPDSHNMLNFTEKVKVHFTKCSDIIPKRTHNLNFGYFDIDDEVLVSFLTETFRKWLEKQMHELYEKTVIDSDERLINLNKMIFSTESSTEALAIGDIMKLSNLFPLCIKGILGRLKAQKHLKYQDRQTLCLFFKDIGMGLNECIEFFKSNFGCTHDQFNKEYLYNIRHNYGLEGKRANYHSFTCSRIIGFSNDGVSFGCPFVNNHDFVKLNSDIEDLNKDAVKCCGRVGAKVIGEELKNSFQTPADYFRILFKENQLMNK
ncbi:uncharacterized protein VICG_00475 [Vittaforma corneae ATCC 50505]|uniref:DNA primase large subunit C-terminal domain-containing protein n=1 Tax=Vittaforma corneae (strain ATCC 50505) TaxID=993615 RepID=L2GPX7_VITCO|nr:uncharacterized protein VICG_00475 [Vittaforma corneae ATCC 50505]ELA42377.1 hypothetical protein VICG_00475 [Vittaforma corneae ATCC 50505]